MCKHRFSTFFVRTVFTVFSDKLLKYQQCQFNYQINVIFPESDLNVGNVESQSC